MTRVRTRQRRSKNVDIVSCSGNCSTSQYFHLNVHTRHRDNVTPFLFALLSDILFYKKRNESKMYFLRHLKTKNIYTIKRMSPKLPFGPLTRPGRRLSSEGTPSTGLTRDQGDGWNPCRPSVPVVLKTETVRERWGDGWDAPRGVFW